MPRGRLARLLTRIIRQKVRIRHVSVQQLDEPLHLQTGLTYDSWPHTCIDMSNDSRIPSGVPTGGQFTAHTRQESDASLPDVDTAARLDELREMEAAVHRETFEVARAAVTARIRDRHPSAATFLLEDQSDDRNPYFTPGQILDEDGNVLFDGEALGALAFDQMPVEDETFYEELADLTPLLDRNGKDAVTLDDLDGRWGIHLL